MIGYLRFRIARAYETVVLQAVEKFIPRFSRHGGAFAKQDEKDLFRPHERPRHRRFPPDMAVAVKPEKAGLQAARPRERFPPPLLNRIGVSGSPRKEPSPQGLLSLCLPSYLQKTVCLPRSREAAMAPPSSRTVAESDTAAGTGPTNATQKIFPPMNISTAANPWRR